MVIPVHKGLRIMPESTGAPWWLGEMSERPLAAGTTKVSSKAPGYPGIFVLANAAKFASDISSKRFADEAFVVSDVCFRAIARLGL